jgi:hypothetical protein
MIPRGAVQAIYVFRRGIAKDETKQRIFIRPSTPIAADVSHYSGSTPAFLTSAAYFASSERK